MIEKVLAQLSPFSFLTPNERDQLLVSAKKASYKSGDIVCGPSDIEFEDLYIILEGQVSVIIDHKVMGFIQAPSYFGELSILFGEPRRATIIADNDVECLTVQSQVIHLLLSKNAIFKSAFSTILKDKQKIFYGYYDFLSKIMAKKKELNFSMSEILPLYKQLNPVLHRGSEDAEIDFPALSYTINKFSFGLTEISCICLSEDLTGVFGKIQNVLSKPGLPISKKQSYKILPGKILLLLRDDISDFIDIITNLALYLIEAKKICKRISSSFPVVTLLTQHYFGNNDNNMSSEEIVKGLFNDDEVIELKKIFKDDFAKNLYEIITQNGEIAIQILLSEVHYYPTASEMWINQIKHLMSQHFDANKLNDTNIHIISSNIHSVRNCLSTWLQEHRKKIIAWACKKNPGISKLNSVDRLYAAANTWFQHHPLKEKERELADEKHGIYYLRDTCLTGIAVTIIDLSKLDSKIDPFLKKDNSKDIIINIDYAYGKQAKIILRCLILLFGTQISSISVFGKAGGIVGARGDIILPDRILLQESDDVIYSIDQDINVSYFDKYNWPKSFYSGGLLTVLGTLMQSRSLLKFYQIFWDIVGLEMEGGYYLQEVAIGKLSGVLNNNVKLRFIYYISDIPLALEHNLARRMRMEEGIPAVYMITRAVLQKIFDSNT